MRIFPESPGLKVIFFTTLLFCLVLPSCSYTSADISSFTVPDDLGTVKETFKAADDYGQGPVIIHIQDAHCNYEAQKNMAMILDYLVREYGLRLIMVEGGSGDVSLSFLRNYSDQATRKDVAEKYLRSGEISGEEYLDIISGYDLELWGIEDQSLYDSNLSSFLDMEEVREDAKTDVAGLLSLVNGLKDRVYNRVLEDFERAGNDYESKIISLSDYCLYLKEVADEHYVSIEEYPEIFAFTETARLEKSLDFEQAELQRNEFVRALAGSLEREEVDELIARTREFKEGMSSAAEYYGYLEDLSCGRVDMEEEYPRLAGYITYVKVSRDIDAAELLKELPLFEDSVRAELFLNDDERRLHAAARAFEVLEKFLNLALPPEEYAYFQEHRDECLTSSWVSFLKEKCYQYGMSGQPQVSRATDDNIDRLDAFYQKGIERERAFMKNAEEKMEESGERIAVLITGGFHTPGITGMMREEGYSYAVVTPVITETGDTSNYFAILKGEKPEEQLSSDWGD